MSSLKIDTFCPVGIGGTKGIDTTKLKLFIGGLLQKHSSKDLYDIFIKYGSIRESVVIPDRFRVRSRCYGFITFEKEKSVRNVLNNLPIVSKEGIKLTVILASENTRPRRAHFSVRHGISGHKPLPTVYENNNNSNNKNKNNKAESIGIYSDPSLFRTANIQQIAPAQFNIKNNKNENINSNKIQKETKTNWPNEDIKKDYKNSKKVTVFNNKYKNNKHWKLISVKKEPKINDYLNYKSLNNNKNNNCDEICSTKSREWTPIKKNYENKYKIGKTKNRNITHKLPSKTQSVVTQTEGETDHGIDNEIEKEIELISEGKLTYHSLICDENNNQNTEIEELKNMFKNKMQIKINENHNLINNYNNNTNGLWSPYQPCFTTNTQSYYNMNEYNFQNMIPTPPIQPIQLTQPIINNNTINYSNEKGFISNDAYFYENINNINNNMNEFTNYTTYSPNEQMNLYYNYNNNSVHSSANSK